MVEWNDGWTQSLDHWTAQPLMLLGRRQSLYMWHNVKFYVFFEQWRNVCKILNICISIIRYHFLLVCACMWMNGWDSTYRFRQHVFSITEEKVVWCCELIMCAMDAIIITVSGKSCHSHDWNIFNGMVQRFKLSA